MTELEALLLDLLQQHRYPLNHVYLADRLSEQQGRRFTYVDTVKALIALRNAGMIYRFRRTGKRRTIFNKLTSTGRSFKIGNQDGAEMAGGQGPAEVPPGP